MKSATLEQRFRLALLFVCVLSLFAFGVADRQVPLTIAFIIAAASGWFVTERGSGGLPRWLTSTILTILVSALLYRAIDNIPPVSLFATFLSVVMILKLWERRAMRDYAQILTIALFLVVGTVLTDPGFSVGVLLIILLPIFIWTVMLYQLHNQASSAGTTLVAWSTLRRGFRGAASFAIIAGSAMATAAFILVPRGYGLGGALQGPSRLAGLQTGFVDEVRLGQSGIISQSSAPVFELSLAYTTAPDVPIGSSSDPQYLRGIILDDYKNGRWSPAPPSIARQPRRDERTGDQILTFGVMPGPHVPVLMQHVRPLLPPRDGSPLFMLLRPYGIKMKPGLQTVSIEYEPAQAWARRPTFDGSGEYTAYSAPDWDPATFPDLGGQQHRPHSRRGEVSFPASDKVAALARRLLTDNNIDPDPARRPVAEDRVALSILQSHLQRRCQYSLDNAPTPLGQDPTEWFLFDARKGHCEYFASALAALSRSVGIDARVVGGYLATEFDESRHTYVVRAWNAHAWVEANVDGDHWITLDATPPSDLAELSKRSSGLFITLARWLDHLQSGWNTSVVTFDQSLQSKILGLGRHNGSNSPPSTLAAHLRDTIDHVTNIPIRDWLMMASPLVVLSGGLVLWRTVHRANRQNLALPGWAMPHAAALLRARLLTHLRRLGHTQPAWQSLEAFVAAAAARDPRVPPAAITLAQHLTRAAMDPVHAAESLAAAHREPALTAAQP
ncbi:MAG: DUF3488 and transglutaminase-like domain-containing protein [Phycisphaerales bacterium]|jgi:hypothetical protein